MIQISENIFCAGNSHVIRGVAIPLAEGIKSIADEYPVTEEYDFELESCPKAHEISEIAWIVGVITFVASWAATTVLNEVYSAKLSPLLKERFGDYFSRKKDERKYALTITTINQETKGCLVIACIGENLEEIELAEKHVESALNYVRSANLQSNPKEVMLLVLENGRLDLDIQFFHNYEQAVMRLKGMYPVKLPSLRERNS